MTATILVKTLFLYKTTASHFGILPPYCHFRLQQPSRFSRLLKKESNDGSRFPMTTFMQIPYFIIFSLGKNWIRISKALRKTQGTNKVLVFDVNKQCRNNIINQILLYWLLFSYYFINIKQHYQIYPTGFFIIRQILFFFFFFQRFSILIHKIN